MQPLLHFQSLVSFIRDLSSIKYSQTVSKLPDYRYKADNP